MSDWTSEVLADFALGLRGDGIPAGVRHAARRCILDLVGAAVAGHGTAAATAIRVMALATFASGPATVWLSGERRHTSAAAFANSAAASALDADDGSRESGGHPGAATIPAVFAVAEEVGASGAEVIDAIVVGYEVGVRVAAARDVSRLVTYSTGCWTAYGVAAAAGRLRRVPEAVLAQGLAIAGTQSPGLAAVGYARAGTHAVKEGIPWSVLTGLAALDLASGGFSGPLDLLDHPDHFDSRAIRGGLGERWAISRTYLKPYACCRWIHPAIDALASLRAAHGLRPDDIRSMRVGLPRRVLTLPNATDPRTIEGAQFSVPFCLAVAATEGADALLPLDSALLGRGDIVALARRVELGPDGAHDARFPAEIGATLTIETSGGLFSESVERPLGDPDNPLSDGRLLAKFRRLTSSRWTAPHVETVARALQDIESGPIARVSELLA